MERALDVWIDWNCSTEPDGTVRLVECYLGSPARTIVGQWAYGTECRGALNLARYLLLKVFPNAAVDALHDRFYHEFIAVYKHRNFHITRVALVNWARAQNVTIPFV